MKKIKVFRIIARLNIGGPAIQSILLTNALNTDRFESILVSGIVEKGESQMDFLLNKYNVKPIFIPELRREVNPISDFIAFCKICRLIIREKPDIIHTHTSKAGVIGRLAAFLLRVPVKVHTFHGHTFYGYFNRYKSRIFLNIERMLSRITDLIIAISPRQAEDIEKYKIANKPKCKIVWLGLDLDMCFAINPQAKEKERVGFKNDEIIVGTVGRITGIKNHRFFLEVAQKFCLSQPQHNVKFVIVGDGELRNQIENYRDHF